MLKKHKKIVIACLVIMMLIANAFPVIGSDGGNLQNLATDNSIQYGLSAAIRNDVESLQEMGLNGTIMQVATGNSFTLMLTSRGTVWAMGMNTMGQLGQGFVSQNEMMVQVYGLTDVVYIAAGNAHGIALKEDGTV